MPGRAVFLAAHLAIMLHCAGGFRVDDPRVDGDVDDPAYFEPGAEGFVGIRSLPTNPEQTRVNEGNQFQLSQPNIFDSVHPRRELLDLTLMSYLVEYRYLASRRIAVNCPGMLQGSDGHYFCTSENSGYCDRRSGTCFCYKGYNGDDCGGCTVTYYRDEASQQCRPRRE
jgi:hypothetical protein